MADPQVDFAPSEVGTSSGNSATPPTTSREARVQAVVEFVRENPAVAIAGSVAAGLIVGRLLPRRSRRTLAARVGKYAELATTAALTFGRHAADNTADAAGNARDAGGRAAKFAAAMSSRFAGKADDVGSAAAKRTGKAADLAAAAISAFSHRAAERIGQTSRVAARKTADLSESAGEHLSDAGEATMSGFATVLAHLGQALIGAGKRMGDTADSVHDKAGR